MWERIKALAATNPVRVFFAGGAVVLGIGIHRFACVPQPDAPPAPATVSDAGAD